jgi:hypothetical protein
MKILNINISETGASTIGLAIVLAIAFYVFYKPITVTERVIPVPPPTAAREVPPPLPPSSKAANLHKQVKRTSIKDAVSF